MSLRGCQSECVELFYAMRRNYPQMRFAAPFLSAPSPFTATNGGRSILLVGKATDGDWKMKDFEACARNKQIEKRRRVARSFIAEMSQKPKSEFWRFFQDLQKIGLPVIWSNLVKIGIKGGNPRGTDLNLQKELAQRTLRAEIDEYKPSLVFLVSGEYAVKEIVSPVFEKSGRWTKPKGKNYWWRNRTEEMPPVLWTYHPQGIHGHKEEWDRWIRQARRLLSKSC